ncbi:hypothetical protein A3C96_00905 [Candidatus Uhrbacteria bacterium RIFCSPHIGHO2_02_FULL_60_10]|uniref:Uncharacterized protein n=1 Tax=Candidatus Uhrbacteria bacterium RIFCSPHIGHO2_02_FULL_60_10 TaxID=1802392 RepID=A0A1F7U689_9BACT|nr:MAG: hypothetical protein A3C96_00905 [Candidatus Uhrbacteria bacterium RIFCSPHIGHO2_02_FULL_60_10]
MMSRTAAEMSRQAAVASRPALSSRLAAATRGPTYGQDDSGSRRIKKRLAASNSSAALSMSAKAACQSRFWAPVRADCRMV